MTGSGVREGTDQMLNCLRKDLNEFKHSVQIVLLGDMNAHIEDLNGYADHSGCLMLDLSQQSQLVLPNTENKCEY